jgi:transpeptidase family protein/MecA-like transpeptidase family protein
MVNLEALPQDRASERQRRVTHRAIPLGALALFSLALGAVIGSVSGSGEESTAKAFARAWERGDQRALYDLLSDATKRRFGPRAVRRFYSVANATATTQRIDVGDPHGKRNGDIRLPVAVRTRAFGTVHGEIAVPVSGQRVDWTPQLVFPGLQPGEELRRRTRAPRRATILSRDGKVLARGPADSRTSPLGEIGSSVAGTLSPAKDRAARRAVYARGLPPTTPIGATGLERAFEDDLEGRPGGKLLAGTRLLARSTPRPAPPVRSTIDSRLQSAAVTALGARFGGVAALDARTGEIRALAGIAFSAPQPPGSTFKIVTTTAALEVHAVRLSQEFPVETHAVIDGVDLNNANGESCGGSFRASFAHSCNSVFAPLGVKVGAKRLVDAAERYGFNEPPRIIGQAPSTLPPASKIRSPLEVGSTAIGQGRVLATPLQLASIAQTVGARGVRTEPVLRKDQVGRRGRVTSRRVARTLRALMLDVVEYGTGTSAAIAGVKVAGKTGTAELGDTRGPNADTTSNQSNTDAWFTAFAPARRPRIAVGVLLVRAGAGGTAAAPVAKAVMETALQD